MSTHNIWFGGEIRKITILFDHTKKKCLIWSYFKVIMFKCILLLIDLDAFDVWLTVYLYVDEVTLSN